jgi:hypothetical protein
MPDMFGTSALFNSVKWKVQYSAAGIAWQNHSVSDVDFPG